jgi:hypothetical protein
VPTGRRDLSEPSRESGTLECLSEEAR